MADTIVEAVSRALDEAPPRNFRETVDLAVNLLRGICFDGLKAAIPVRFDETGRRLFH